MAILLRLDDESMIESYENGHIQESSIDSLIRGVENVEIFVKYLVLNKKQLSKERFKELINIASIRALEESLENYTESINFKEKFTEIAESIISSRNQKITETSYLFFLNGIMKYLELHGDEIIVYDIKDMEKKDKQIKLSNDSDNYNLKISYEKESFRWHGKANEIPEIMKKNSGIIYAGNAIKIGSNGMMSNTQKKSKKNIGKNKKEAR